MKYLIKIVVFFQILTKANQYWFRFFYDTFGQNLYYVNITIITTKFKFNSFMSLPKINKTIDNPYH